MIFKKTWYKYSRKSIPNIEYMYTVYFFFFIIPIFIKREIVKIYS